VQPERRHQHRSAQLTAAGLAAALAATLLLLSGCGSLGGLGGSDRSIETPEPVVDRAQAQTQAMVFYLELLHRMVRAGSAEQAEIFANVRRDYDANAANPPAQLRLALALSAPNHPSTDGAAAQRLLRQVLSAPEQLTDIEHAVAYLELQKLDRQLLLAAENDKLQSSANGRSERDRVTALNRRLAAESEENARLKKALDEARAKLDAIAAIERQSSERNPPPGRTP